jgi:hypothetical protein
MVPGHVVLLMPVLLHAACLPNNCLLQSLHCLDAAAAVAAQELAWASFALLKNVNCCTVLLLRPSSSEVLLARGSVANSMATAASDAAVSLDRIAQVMGRRQEHHAGRPLFQHMTFHVNCKSGASR